MSEDDEDLFLDDEEEGGDLEDQLEAALDAAYIEGAMEEADDAVERPANVPLEALKGEDGVWRLPKESAETPPAGSEPVADPAPPADGRDDQHTPPAPPLSEEGAMGLLAEIWKLNDDVQEVRLEMAMRRAQFKSSKADLDKLLERLAELTDRKKAMERAKAERLPLFPVGVDAIPKASLVDGDALKKGDPVFLKTPPADPNAWRKAPISDLVLSAPIQARLQENGVSTVGELEDLRASGKGLAGIKGFGPAKITTIEDAVMEWLKKNRDQEAFAAVAAAAGSEGPDDAE